MNELMIDLDKLDEVKAWWQDSVCGVFYDYLIGCVFEVMPRHDGDMTYFGKKCEFVRYTDPLGGKVVVNHMLIPAELLIPLDVDELMSRTIMVGSVEDLSILEPVKIRVFFRHWAHFIDAIPGNE